jgi:hypothetical protein
MQDSKLTMLVPLANQEEQITDPAFLVKPPPSTTDELVNCRIKGNWLKTTKYIPKRSPFYYRYSDQPTATKYVPKAYPTAPAVVAETAAPATSTSNGDHDIDGDCTVSDDWLDENKCINAALDEPWKERKAPHKNCLLCCKSFAATSWKIRHWGVGQHVADPTTRHELIKKGAELLRGPSPKDD